MAGYALHRWKKESSFAFPPSVLGMTLTHSAAYVVLLVKNTSRSTELGGHGYIVVRVWDFATTAWSMLSPSQAEAALPQPNLI